MTTSGRWKLGLTLALTTSALWGVLPVVLKALLLKMDPITITWFRFLVSAVALGAFQAHCGRLPKRKMFSPRAGLFLAGAVGGLIGNYVLYLFGLNYVSPETSQMIIQLAPVFLLLGGLFFFGESFGLGQWLGLATLLGGLLLFFNNRLAHLVGGARDFYIGVSLTIVAAVSWAGYALAQKRLLRTFSSDQILVIIYGASIFLLLPAARPGELLELDTIQWALLLFACANTLVAYGAFAEALAHWEASRVSAVLAVTPLLTFTAIWWLSRHFPNFAHPEALNPASWTGAALVVAGSISAALGRPRKSEPPPPLE